MAIGTWRVDPSTFDVIDYSETRPRSEFTGKILVINADGIFEETYAAGRRVVGPQMPTNYANFALIFEKGGSFMATNIPAGLFFDWAAMSELSGKWSLQAAVAVSLKMGEKLPGNNELQDIQLSATRIYHVDGRAVFAWSSTTGRVLPKPQPSASPQPSLRLDVGKNNQMKLTLIKQRDAASRQNETKQIEENKNTTVSGSP